MKSKGACLFLAIFFGLIGGCGGGGSSSSTSNLNSGSSTVTPTAEYSIDNPPALPQAKYQGISTAATLTSSDVVDYTDQVFLSANFLYSVANSNQIKGGPYTGTHVENGPAGGTVTVIAEIDSYGDGWIKDTFDNYQVSNGSGTPNSIENGVLILYYKAFGNQTGELSNLGTDNYQVQIGSSVTTYNGNFKITWNQASPDIVGTISIDLGSNLQLFLSNFEFIDDKSIQNGLATLTGKLYLSNLGYVTVSTPSDVDLNLTSVATSTADVLPQTRGEVDLQGANGVTLEIEPLDENYVWLGLDTNGDGIADEGTRLVRSAGKLDTVVENNFSVEADAEIVGSGSYSSIVVLTGKYSHSSSGFVAYNWKLIATPPGSQVTASGTGPTLQFQPDLPGGYTAELTASANGKSKTDFVTVNYAGSDPNITASAPTQFKVPEFLQAKVGQVVTLDGRASSQQSSGVWTLTTPDGSSAVLQNADSPLAQFTPDVTGIYSAWFCGGQQSQCVDSLSEHTIVEVGLATPVRFGPPTLLGGYDPLGDLPSNLTIGNFGVSGREGIGAMVTDSSNSTAFSWWSAGLGLPELSSLQSVTLPDLTGCISTNFTDVNGDGWPDIFCTMNSGVAIWLSQGDFSYVESNALYPSTEPAPTMPNNHAVGTIAGKPAAVLLDSFTTISGVAMDIDSYEFGGGATSPTPVVTPVTFSLANFMTISAVKLADINGDGKADLIFRETFNSASIPDELRIFLGNGDGTFTYDSSYPLKESTLGQRETILVKDFNADGHEDIATVDSGGLHIYYGDGAGGFGTDAVIPIACGQAACSVKHINGNYPALVEAPTRNASNVQLCNSIGFVFNQNTNELGPDRWYPMFVEPPSSSTGNCIDGMTVGDYNGDGVPDLFFYSAGYYYLVPGLAPSSPTLDKSTGSTVLRMSQNHSRVLQDSPRSLEWPKNAALN